ncbi:MAG: MBL fold metallo-hydrolase, partial [Christensenellales bacterium]
MRYDIGVIYMPDMQSSSKTYKELIAAIDGKGIPVTEAYAGLDFTLGPSLCTIVSPQKDANKDANNESIVIFLDYGETDFLFTGDVEAWGEAAILSAGYIIDADVLKVAHHGSRSGTTEEFLTAVSPEYAVISCGAGNKYGHPHEETLELLRRYGVKTYRTDISGDIVFFADGRELNLADAG